MTQSLNKYELSACDLTQQPTDRTTIGRFSDSVEAVGKLGRFFDGREARSRPRTGAPRTAGRAATGVWRVGGCAESNQELRKRLADASWGKRAPGRALW